MVDRARSAILEVMTNAALAGYDLGEFEAIDGPAPGYQAKCRRCGKTAWVGENGLIYSLLGDDCPDD